jgi:polysaccharide export outer membrane protein
MKKNILILFAIAVGLTQTSCYINSEVMLKTDRDFKYNEIPENVNYEYIISPNDILEMRLFANKGFLVIDISSGAEESQRMTMAIGRNFISYPIYDNGDVKLPIIEYVNLTGMTIKEAEKHLESLYAEYYVDPYVQLGVINRRVVVFPGAGGDAKVITLLNNNTTLLETLALAGGLSKRGKANRIKLIRTVDGKREVYLIDLSDIEGLKLADIIVQANDIIYVEPVPEIAREVLQEVTPILSLISSLFIIYLTIQNIK